MSRQITDHCNCCVAIRTDSNRWLLATSQANKVSFIPWNEEDAYTHDMICGQTCAVIYLRQWRDRALTPSATPSPVDAEYPELSGGAK